MNFFSALSIVFAGILSAINAAAATPESAPASAVAQPVHALPMRFDKLPLGNVARLLSARFSVTVSIAAKAKAPITGDFSTLDLKASLAECARQAGLTVVPLGTAPSDGYLLGPPPANDTERNHANAPEKRTDDQAALAAAAARRAGLLRQRQALLAQESAPQSQGSDDAPASR
jgi:hypothetical protein